MPGNAEDTTGCSGTAHGGFCTEESNNRASCLQLPARSCICQDERVLPDFIANGLRGAFLQISKHKPAYYTNEAILVGVESRTSSPVRMPRDPDTLQHPGVSGLFSLRGGRRLRRRNSQCSDGWDQSGDGYSGRGLNAHHFVIFLLLWSVLIPVLSYPESYDLFF